MTDIAFDTDFLIKITNDPIPKLDLRCLSSKNELILIPSVLREIRGLEKSRIPVTSRRARMALKTLKESKIFVSSFEDTKATDSGEADLSLIEFVRENPRDRMVASLDGSLLAQMEKMGLPYLTLSRGRVIFHSYRRATYLTSRKNR